MRASSQFLPVRHPSYGGLLLGLLISNVGWWMERVSVGIYVTSATGKAGWTGTVAALLFLPGIVASPLGGVLADRFDRRRYVLTMTLLQALLAAALAGLAHLESLSVPKVAVVVLLTGMASSLVHPAMNALTAELVPRARLTEAISLNSAQFNLARILGPLAAAAALATGSYTVAFATNALSFAAVLVAVAAIGRPSTTSPSRPRKPSSWFSGLSEGFAAARGDAGVIAALALMATSSLLIAPFMGLAPAFAMTVLGADMRETALLTTFQGAGAVLAALSTGRYAEVAGRSRWAWWMSLTVAPLGIAYWLAPSLPFLLAAIFLLGGNYLAVIVTANSTCLSRVTPELHARISSLFIVLLDAAYVVGLTTLGWLGDVAGLRTAGAAACGLYLLIRLLVGARAPALFERMR